MCLHMHNLRLAEVRDASFLLSLPGNCKSPMRHLCVSYIHEYYLATNALLFIYYLNFILSLLKTTMQCLIIQIGKEICLDIFTSTCRRT